MMPNPNSSPVPLIFLMYEREINLCFIYVTIILNLSVIVNKLVAYKIQSSFNALQSKA